MQTATIANTIYNAADNNPQKAYDWTIAKMLMAKDERRMRTTRRWADVAEFLFMRFDTIMF